jgi:hypothetical protein
VSDSVLLLTIRHSRDRLGALELRDDILWRLKQDFGLETVITIDGTNVYLKEGEGE